MIPFQVDPSWYERYWLTERPGPPAWDEAVDVDQFC